MFLLGRAVLVWVFHKSLTTPLSKLHLDQFDRLSTQQINRQNTQIYKGGPIFLIPDSHAHPTNMITMRPRASFQQT